MDGVLELTVAEQKRGTDPMVWAATLSSSLSAAGVSMPSVEAAEILVSDICWSNNVPIAWKYLEKALSIRVVPPLFVLALLSDRVIPNRRRYPVAYRLYMEFVKKYAFSMQPLINGPNYHKIMASIDSVLQFNQIFGVQSSDPGHLVAVFIFSVVWELVDASLDDEGLLQHTLEKKSRWPIESQDIEIEWFDCFVEKKMEHQATFSKMNTAMGIQIIGDFFENEVTSQILYLVRRNMPMHWDSFIQNLRLLIASSSIKIRNSQNISPDVILQLAYDKRRVLNRASKMSIMATAPMPSVGKFNGTDLSALWLPIDLYLEDTVDRSEVNAISASETLTGLVKALQTLNQITWQDAFLGLWTAALRLVQRHRNSVGSSDPRLNTSLCMLLSIATLVVVNIVKEEDNILSDEGEQSSTSQIKHTLGKRHEDLVLSLQQLGGFEALLTPPPLVSSLANQAAAKAMMFLSGISVDSEFLSGMTVSSSGNLRHLIVEACIARNVLDVSAYLWPGYVRGCFNEIPRNISGQIPGWSSFMNGSPLTPPLISSLVSTPATSLSEIDRMYEVAVSGTDDEKISAATILCGASLLRGWNIQEHTAVLITRLLSPADCFGSGSHLIGYAPFLNVLTVGMTSLDCIQILSLHGLIPQLATALMPICEVFGSFPPNMSWTLNTGEQISSYDVFSSAFILLLTLWRFDQPSLNHVMGDGAPVGSNVTLDYLLLVHNSQLASYEKLPKNNNKPNRLSRLSYSSLHDLVFMDSFPKLKRWYRKHQECIASVSSSLVPGNTIHEIVEALLSMMFSKHDKGQPLTPTSDESNVPHKFSAWDILEAVPFVLDASLTACDHGRLSPRELTIGLKDLADFLPASLATILSYCSAEVTRGHWKPALLNGTDWPSPAANLSMVEEKTKEILAATGVSVSCPALESYYTVAIPLPLAALIGLTVTYQIHRGGEYYFTFVGPTMKRLAKGCPWPCMSVISALWAQKAKHWTDYLILEASQTVFHHNNDAIVQLLRSCFTAALGLNSCSASNSGVAALLGHGFGYKISDSIFAVTPGTLYLKVHRAVRNVKLITEEMVYVLIQTVKDITNSGLTKRKTVKPNKTKCGHVSLPAAMDQVKTAASLGASLVCVNGGLIPVQFLFQEILPSLFISNRGLDCDNPLESNGMFAVLAGYSLAYLAVFSGLFSWGVDSSLLASKRRQKVIGRHFEFLASALEGRIWLGCDKATWRAYVTRYLSLMIDCCSEWMIEVNVEVVKRVSKGLKQWNERDMAVALLGISGIGAMGAATEMIIRS